MSIFSFIFIFKERVTLCDMEGEVIQLMPARCSRCGAIFDLRYDFEGVGGDGLSPEVFARIARKSDRMQLCWDCRLG